MADYSSEAMAAAYEIFREGVEEGILKHVDLAAIIDKHFAELRKDKARLDRILEKCRIDNYPHNEPNEVCFMVPGWIIKPSEIRNSIDKEIEEASE